MDTLLYLRPDKNTATGPEIRRLDAAPLTGCGEERADLNKADHSVKKKLNEKKNSPNPLKMEDSSASDGAENEPISTNSSPFLSGHFGFAVVSPVIRNKDSRLVPVRAEVRWEAARPESA